MTFGERRLDGGLAFEKPVEGIVKLVLVDLAEAKFDAEARCRRGGIERAGDGQFGGRRDNAIDDHRQNEVARSVAVWTEQTIETDRAGDAEAGSDMAVRQRAFDRQRLLSRRQHNAAFQQGAKPLAHLDGPMGEIEQRAFTNAAPVPIALAQEDSGR